MDKINKPFAYTLLIVILLFFSNIFFIHLWWTKPCNCEGKPVIEWRDSTAPNKEPERVIISGKITKVKARKFNGNLQSRVGSLVYTNTINTLNSTTDSTVTLTCLDTNFYKSDTISPENFRATATATVTNNELINIKVDYKNLAPEKWRIETITKTVVQQQKQSLVKVYLGVNLGATIPQGSIGIYNGGGNVDAIIADKHMIGINGGINSLIQPQIGIRFSEKISFRKK
jgi:hypothetical protein